LQLHLPPQLHQPHLHHYDILLLKDRADQKNPGPLGSWFVWLISSFWAIGRVPPRTSWQCCIECKSSQWVKSNLPVPTSSDDNVTLQILTCFIWFPTLTEVEKQPLHQIVYPVLCCTSPFSTNNLYQGHSDRFDCNWKKKERAILFSFQKLLSTFEGFRQLMNLPEYFPVSFI
jgi:hypothetical protein